MPIALTRQISPRFAECELTFAERLPIDLALAHAQHHAYTQALESLGCQVLELPGLAEYPDSVFVEDVAFILPEAAVLTRPGAESRRGEVEVIVEPLCPFRELLYVREPATVDGGDVLVLGKNIYIGLSTRSSVSSLSQIHSLLSRFGYRVFLIPIYDCLHLKSAVTRINEKTLLINPQMVDKEHFKGFDLLEVDPSEPHAGNILPVGDRCIYPSAYPKTLALLEARGIKVIPLDLSEILKAEGAVTCCSLIL